MKQIYYELSVLAKAIHFKNLSAAALHVGLSQPQLSRIIAKIEDELKIVLLDRSAKRKSGWTAVAVDLAQIFEKSMKRLEVELQSVSQHQMISDLHIGTLEGLSPIAMELARLCFSKIGIHKIFLDIYDLNELEANFMSGNIDFILSSKWPGRQKFRHSIEIGFQQLEKIQTNKDYAVLSTFEHGRMESKGLTDFKHILVSNSLIIRKEWFKSPGGTGLLPSAVAEGKQKGAEQVLLVGSEVLNPQLWKEIQNQIDFFME